MSIVCDTGFINIVDPFLNPDSTVWTGSITYTLQYATTVAGATLVEARQVINVSDGIDICLAPGLYTVVYNQSGQRLPVTSQWTVPPTGGPYTIADLEGVGPVTGSLTVTGPFIAMSTVTMTSLINAAARPYVATDSVGLLSTGNLALIAISGSASDLGSGTLSAARLPALTGDATSSVGSAATTVVKINGTALSGLATGLLKNTTTTGVPSIAIAGTDYAVATNGTIGQALTSNGTGGFSTALTLATVATSGSASDLTAGTLAAARMPAITGDVTTTVGTVAATVVKINGTTLSSLATGLLKNTTATGVPSIAVAGTDLIGGVGNLTTVGSVPYVSASGTLNQDAGQLHWDATNNRLGIGTVTPSSLLTVGANNFTVDALGRTSIAGYSTGAQLSIGADPTALLGDVTIMRQGRDTDTGSNYIQSFGINTANGRKLYLGGYSASFNPASGVVLTVDPANSRVGIGTTTPSTLLHIQTTTGYGLRLTGAGTAGGSDSTNGAGINLSYNAVGNRQIWIGDTATNFGIRLINSQMDGFDLGGGTSRAMALQVNGNPLSIGTGATGYSLQVYGNSALNVSGVFNAASSAGASYLMVNNTGNVGIGTTTPVYLLDVAKSGASGTARFYDQAATGATRVLITLGAADTTSTQVFEIGGLMKFSGSNSTGANSALLGTNCPAVTFTAPYTWLKVLTSDGSTAYVPAWK